MYKNIDNENQNRKPKIKKASKNKTQIENNDREHNKRQLDIAQIIMEREAEFQMCNKVHKSHREKSNKEN